MAVAKKIKKITNAVVSSEQSDSAVSQQELSCPTAENFASDSSAIQATQKFWSSRGIKLTAFECQEAIENVTRFFTILDKWQRQSEK